MHAPIHHEPSHRHGGPFDRGMADYYYRRPCRPHYFEAATYMSSKIIPMKESPEWHEYMCGYQEGAAWGDRKTYKETV